MATTLTETVAADADDGWLAVNSEEETFDGAFLKVGYDDGEDDTFNLFVRFSAVDLEPGINITAANLVFIHNASGDAFASKIRVDLDSSANPATYDSGSDMGGATVTSSGSAVAWTIPSASSGTTATSPDVTSLVNSLLALGNWATGQAMIFQITYNGDSSSAEETRLSAHEHGSHNPPKLVVTYADPIKAGGVTQTLMLGEMF